MGGQRNWAGNLTYSARKIHEPGTLDELRGLVRRSQNIRALGSRHSFNAIADSTADLVSLARLSRIVGIDRERRTVTIEGGVRYGQLGEYLTAAGFALANLASLPHISVAGACATATHGSGERNGNLATAVSAMQLLSPEGDVISVARDTTSDFDGMVVSLGALGIVVGMTLDVFPAFDVRQDVYENMSLGAACDNFDAIQASAYSVSFFTNWQNDRFDQLWLKRATGAALAEMPVGDARRATENLHPIPGSSAESCTPQLGIAGPWHERLPHFRMEFTPSRGDELQSEYFVPRERAADALRAMMQLGDHITPLLLVSEIRTVAADRLWLSPCYEQATVALHFTWKQQWPEVRALLPEIEAALAPFGARPHWGKLFTMAPAHIGTLFQKLPDFRRLLASYDPDGKFRNTFIDEYIFGSIS